MLLFFVLFFSSCLSPNPWSFLLLLSLSYPHSLLLSQIISPFFYFLGFVKPGLDILRTPSISHNFGEFFLDCIPIALVLFMESYSVARRIASTNNELHLLNASQELFANGVANLLGSVSSAYPVSGSYSRSALNNCNYYHRHYFLYSLRFLSIFLTYFVFFISFFRFFFLYCCQLNSQSAFIWH